MAIFTKAINGLRQARSDRSAFNHQFRDQLANTKQIRSLNRRGVMTEQQAAMHPFTQALGGAGAGAVIGMGTAGMFNQQDPFGNALSFAAGGAVAAGAFGLRRVANKKALGQIYGGATSKFNKAIPQQVQNVAQQATSANKNPGMYAKDINDEIKQRAARKAYAVRNAAKRNESFTKASTGTGLATTQINVTPRGSAYFGSRGGLGSGSYTKPVNNSQGTLSAQDAAKVIEGRRLADGSYGV